MRSRRQQAWQAGKRFIVCRSELNTRSSLSIAVMASPKVAKLSSRQAPVG
jgi:hypothetical protein